MEEEKGLQLNVELLVARVLLVNMASIHVRVSPSGRA